MNEPALPPSMEAQLRALLAAIEASNQGDFSHRLPVNGTHPLLDQLAEAFNTSASRNAAITQDLAHASSYKSTLLSISRVLRTPLNSLLILAKLLADNKEGNLGNKQVEYAKMIHASGDDLLTLINEILDLDMPKRDADALKVKPQDILFSELHQLMDRAFRPVAEQTNLTFTVELAPNTPRAIRTDPQRLQQILKNLLSNAFKFTNQGSVKMRVRLAEKNELIDHEVLRNAESVIAFAVTDTGIGIPKDKQKLIFEAFHYEDSSTARKHGVTGLGLSISREFARLLGGEILVQSEPGQGSTFTLYLPENHTPRSEDILDAPPAPIMAVPDEVLERPQRSWRQPPPPAEPRASLAGCKALLIEGDVRNIFALNTVLERNQMKVVFAETGKKGVELLKANPDVDAILMEVILPDVDGYQIMRAIREDRRFDLLPIIALTAQTQEGTRENCLAAGASDYLPKPVEIDELLAMLRRWCR